MYDCLNVIEVVFLSILASWMMRCNIDDTAAVTDVDFQVKHTGDFLFHFISKLCKVKLSLRGSNFYFELR